MPNKTVSLSGAGVSDTSPAIEFISQESTSTNSTVEVNSTSVNRTITVGGFTLTSSIRYEIGGVDAEAFDISETNWDPATGGVLTVLFSPKQERADNATLTIYSAGAEPQVITLSGEGKAMKATTAIDNISPETVKVYPNPATDGITIETFGQNIGKAIEIYSVTGVMVSRSTIEGPVTTVDLASFAKGAYVVRINGKPYKVVKI